MIDHRTLDELTDKLLGAMPEGIKLMQRDVEKNLRAVLEAGLSKMNLVTREEFDVQAALLARLQQRIKQLEEHITRLEK